jgi:RNA 2',3'-cyclic 3'-phosphodiesterase
VTEPRGRGGRQGFRDRGPVEDPDRPRLFFAVPLPDDVREAIRPVRDEVQAAVGDGHARIRWVRIESLHLTLRFLGPTSLDEAGALSRAGERAAREQPPFDVTIAGAGSFPIGGHPRTLWLGIPDGADDLTRLAHGLDAALERPPDDRPFAPHLTLARTDGLRLADAAASALANAAAGRAWSFRADRMVLYRSHLGEGPAWYEPLAEARLG